MNGGVTLTIVSGNTGGTFSLSGPNLVMAAALDYETTSFYDLVIQAADGGFPTPLTSQVRHAYERYSTLRVHLYGLLSSFSEY